MDFHFVPARRPWLLTACLALGIIGFLTPSHAQTTLAAKLTPTVVVTGPPGSLQQVQYSTNLNDTNMWVTLAHVRMTTPEVSFHDTTAQGERRFYRTKLVGVADTNLIWIPPGTFVMGSPDDQAGRATNEGPVTTVMLTRGFFMGRYEVKNAEYLAYMLPIYGDPQIRETHPQHAARHVDFFEALQYCAARTTQERAQGLIPPGWVYRLPTEAEWEYAARGGTQTAFSFGNEIRNDGLRADAAFDGRFPYPTNVIAPTPTNYPVNSIPPGGTYAPNAFGLYDMHGGVNEWCWDAIANNLAALPGGSVTNPVGTGSGVTFPIYRGGGAYDPGRNCRVAARHVSNDQISSAAFVGLRVVLIPAEP